MTIVPILTLCFVLAVALGDIRLALIAAGGMVGVLVYN